MSTGSRPTEEATTPRRFAFPTFSDPERRVRLVRVLSGPFAGLWLAVSDAGVDVVVTG
jgi:hypothetical protein